MATVGQVLIAPETGWRRYDDADSRIVVDGSKTSNAATGYNVYNLTQSCIEIGKTIKFKFYGTKLRVLQTTWSGPRSNSILVYIDNVLIGTYKGNGSNTGSCLMCEALNLSNMIHEVKIINDDTTIGNNFFLDAIDIDSDGYLMHPILNQVSDINNMSIGDCVPCRYTALTSGVAGYFNELGTCIANEIPTTGAATPDGLFYFIKTDKGTLIADRVIQSSISWDALNNFRLVEGRFLNYDTTVLMHMDDNSFKDECGHTVTNNGGVTLDTTNKAFGTGSAYFNGSIQSLNISDAPDLNFGNEDFTIDFKIRLESLPSVSSVFVSKRTGGNYYGGICIGYNTSGNLLIWATSTNDSTSGSWDIANSVPVYPALSLNKQYHVVVTRIGGRLYVFLDGTYTLISSSTASIGISTAPWRLGSDAGGTSIKGNIDEFRMIKGYGYWNESFTVPTEPHSITKSDKTYIRSISGGCAYVDTNGNKTLTNANKGAWPINNEWDKYIVNSDLNGEITKGDDNIWHYKIASSWCKDTTINGTWNDGLGHTSTGGVNTSRILRGYGTTSWLDVNFGTSSSTGTAFGFRPVLNYIEDNIKDEFIY